MRFFKNITTMNELYEKAIYAFQDWNGKLWLNYKFNGEYILSSDPIYKLLKNIPLIYKNLLIKGNEENDNRIPFYYLFKIVNHVNNNGELI